MWQGNPPFPLEIWGKFTMLFPVTIPVYLNWDKKIQQKPTFIWQGQDLWGKIREYFSWDKSLQPGRHWSYILNLWVFNNPSTPNYSSRTFLSENYLNYLLFFFFYPMLINGQSSLALAKVLWWLRKKTLFSINIMLFFINIKWVTKS